MKTIYIAGGLVAAYLFLRAPKKANPQGGAQVGQLSEQPIYDGTNWTGDLWSRFWHAADLHAPGGYNIGGEVNADPSESALRRVNLQPGWDGGLQ